MLLKTAASRRGKPHMNYWYLLPPVIATIVLLVIAHRVADPPGVGKTLMAVLGIGIAVGVWLSWSYGNGEKAACHRRLRTTPTARTSTAGIRSIRPQRSAP